MSEYCQEKKISKADTSSFDLGFGEQVQVEPLGLGYKLQTCFIGMEKYKYLIVRLSPLGTDAKTVYEFLYRDNTAKLFYTREGVLHGFMTKVISYITAPYRHVYLTYPHAAEFFTMRGHARRDTHVPARLSWNGSEFKGMALNFSEGGCCVAVEPPADSDIELGGMKVEMVCNLVSADKDTEATCVVRNLRRAKGKLILGLSFESVPDVSRARVHDFLQYLGRFS